MIDLRNTNPQMRLLLARALSASSSATTVADQKGRSLDASGTLGTAAGDVLLADLAQTAQSMGLSLDSRDDAVLIWGLRNAIARDETGASWLPSIATKLVRKTHRLVVEASDALGAQVFEAQISPTDLILRSLEARPPKILVVQVDWDDFVRVLATDPDTRAWRTWLRSEGIHFRNEPFWLRMMLKLL